MADISGAQADALEEHVLHCLSCCRAARAVPVYDSLVAAVHGTGPGQAGDDTERDVVAALIGRLRPLRRLVASHAGGTMTGGDTGGSAVRAVCDALAPPQEADEVGRVGHYGILRVLGSGGMGVVFAARQASPRRLVALKMLLTDRHAERVARFRSETEIVAGLRHPNIVQVHEASVQDGRSYFTMEYVDGGSLAQKLAIAPLAPPAAAQLAMALALAIDFAHEHGVIHRDLKPSNVLLTEDGVPKIGDFGLAKHFRGDTDAAAGCTESGALLGTPNYMAPEQATGRNQDVGRSADIYALGAILYECITGRPPFKAASVLETLEQVRTQEPMPPGRLQPRLPRDLQTICLKCLEKDPRRRYASARALADDLERFLAGKPIAARPVRAWERLWKWARRRPAAAALVAVSVASVVTLVAVALVDNVRLSTAVDRAETGEARAKEQQLRADVNYRKARDTVQRMLSRLENQGLSGVPRLKELEQQQLEDALAFYQEILQGLDSPDPEVRLDVARACRQTGAIQSKLGRNGAAEKNLRQAIGLAEGLHAESPVRADYRAELAASCILLGNVLRSDGARGPEAERWLRQALALRRELNAIEPTAARQHDLAETLQTLAVLYFAMPGHLNEAKVLLDEAGGIWEQLVRERPEEDVFRVSLANTCSNLGHFYEWTKRAADAEAVYRKAEPLLEALVQKQPGKIEWATSLASLYARQGNILSQQGKPELALARFTSALDTVQALLKQEPRYAPAQGLLLHAHGGRAYALQALKRFKEALPEWDRVVELEDGPGKNRFRRSERAIALARTGDHRRAAAEAEDLTAKGPVTNEVLYNSACAFSLAAAAALQDEQITATERRVFAEKHSARGVALLRRLRTTGFFQTTGYINDVKTDPDFEPLRRRPECQQLLRDIEQAK